MNSIELVTAFFNVGRESYKAIPRTDNTYIKNFSFWSRLNNRLVVYTDKNSASIVRDIRNGFGLGEKTRVVVIDDIYSIEPSIYANMKKISSNELFSDFRFLPNATSNIAEYSYLMLLKTWFLKDAVEKGYVKGQVAWIDFGFNHGGDLYTNPEEFDFEWTYNFPDRINLFYYEKYDTKPIFEIVRRLCDCFMGCLYILPDHLCETLWQLTKKSMIELNALDLIDDDQLLLMMAYRKEPELFNISKSEWFLPIKEYGGSHLSIKPKSQKSKIKRAVIELIHSKRKRKLVKRYSKVTTRNLLKGE